MRSYFKGFIHLLKQLNHMFKMHFQFSLVNVVSLCVQNGAERSWERTSCEQMRHLKCQFRAHSNANWWCFMVQPTNSCCLNLSFQTKAFITTIKRKLKMFHFPFSLYGIFLSQCIGLETTLVINHECYGWLERENKAFNREKSQRRLIFWR